MSLESFTSAVILAAGEGKRVGGPPKQFLPLCGKPLLAHSLETFQKCSGISEIVITAPPGRIAETEAVAEKFGAGKARVIAGGGTRFESARLGFEETRDDDGVAVFHDAARPFVSEDSITAVISAAFSFGAASAAIPLDDAVKTTHVPPDGKPAVCFGKTVPRSAVWRVQTPQAFRKSLLRRAYENFSGDPEEVTDEAALFEGTADVVVTAGRRLNMKVTTAEDFAIAGLIGRGIEKGSFTVPDNTV